MDNNETQEKEELLLDLYKIWAYIPNDAQGNPLTPFGNFCAGYEAAQQQSAGETIRAISLVVVAREAVLENKILELKADNERLREALEMANKCLEYHYNNGAWGMDIEGTVYVCQQALASTPAQSLIEHDDT